MKTLKAKFSKYAVMDSHGTLQYCWTLKGAQSWLPFCSNTASIWDCHLGEYAAKRVQA